MCCLSFNITQTFHKSGVFTGSYAINPVNGKKIPIWVGDYVLLNYGTGAIMAVPGHDERDYEFAHKYSLEIPQVVDGENVNLDEQAFIEDGIDKDGVLRILEDAGIGLPNYYSWRSRSGCYFCFYHTRGEWKSLKEKLPDLFEKAKLLLREKGQSKADKKSGRTTAQGLVKVEISNDYLSILEVNCETDFAAKDTLFDEFVNNVSKLILSNSIETIDQLNQEAIDEFDTVEDYRKFVVSKIGENITVRRFERIPVNGIAGSYIHGTKIASVVVIENGDEQLAKDIAMHVAASQPEYIQISDIPEDVIDEERKILTKQVEDEGKPAEIVPKIVDGKLNKQFNSITLMGQEFIKDPDLTVAKLLEKSCLLYTSDAADE